MSDYFATQAFWAGNQAARAQAREQELLEALEDAEAEILAWKQMYAKDMREAIRGKMEA